MKKKQIGRTITDLDDLNKVLKTIEILFRQIFDYYAQTNVNHLYTFIMSVAAWLGSVMIKLGLDKEE